MLLLQSLRSFLSGVIAGVIAILIWSSIRGPGSFYSLQQQLEGLNIQKLLIMLKMRDLCVHAAFERAPKDREWCEKHPQPLASFIQPHDVEIRPCHSQQLLLELYSYCEKAADEDKLECSKYNLSLDTIFSQPDRTSRFCAFRHLSDPSLLALTKERYVQLSRPWDDLDVATDTREVAEANWPSTLQHNCDLLLRVCSRGQCFVHTLDSPHPPSVTKARAMRTFSQRQIPLQSSPLVESKTDQPGTQH